MVVGVVEFVAGRSRAPQALSTRAQRVAKNILAARFVFESIFAIDECLLGADSCEAAPQEAFVIATEN